MSFLTVKKGQGTCSGDSGGPVVYKGKQVGIVSFGVDPSGQGGCAKGIPDGIVSVYFHRNWIKKYTKI